MGRADVLTLPDRLAQDLRRRQPCGQALVQREQHRLAVRAAAVSGSPKFFLGTDSAPHARHTKENACGCAGMYTANAAIELYAEAFEAAGDPVKAFMLSQVDREDLALFDAVAHRHVDAREVQEVRADAVAVVDQQRAARQVEVVDQQRLLVNRRIAAQRMERQHGIRTVLNLRGHNPGSPWYDDEVAESRRLGIQHINFQVAEIDDIMKAWYFLKSQDVRIVFGPGRHPTSGGNFVYFEGHDEVIFEYSNSDRNIVGDLENYRPRQFPLHPTSFCMWGSKPDIAEFRD